jgi:hypothetical protein
VTASSARSPAAVNTKSNLSRSDMTFLPQMLLIEFRIK